MGYSTNPRGGKMFLRNNYFNWQNEEYADRQGEVILNIVVEMASISESDRRMNRAKRIYFILFVEIFGSVNHFLKIKKRRQY